MQNVKAGDHMAESAKSAIDAALTRAKADVIRPTQPDGAPVAPATPSATPPTDPTP